jgi:hypothetical protein
MLASGELAAQPVLEHTPRRIAFEPAVLDPKPHVPSAKVR